MPEKPGGIEMQDLSQQRGRENEDENEQEDEWDRNYTDDINLNYGAPSVQDLADTDFGGTPQQQQSLYQFYRKRRDEKSLFQKDFWLSISRRYRS